MEEKGLTNLKSGDKVVYLPEGRIYDFGCIDLKGYAVIYEEGSRNVGDASTVDAAELEPLDEG